MKMTRTTIRGRYFLPALAIKTTFHLFFLTITGNLESIWSLLPTRYTQRTTRQQNLSTSFHERLFFPSLTSIGKQKSTTKAREKGDDDFFFDPRISPHRYPDGISAGPKEKTLTSSSFGYDILSNLLKREEKQRTTKEPDDDDVFDPRRSPHDYPYGTDPHKKKNGMMEQEEEEWNPLRLASVRQESEEMKNGQSRPRDVKKSTILEKKASPIITTTKTSRLTEEHEQQQQEEDEMPFDPRISPHDYPHGTSKKRVPRNKSKSPDIERGEKTVGVLLIDHGSKRRQSNEHLEDMAKAFQNSVSEDWFVKAVHMEIAEPNIEDGIRFMMEKGCDEIVCHPYFLSPGRHVTEDIPNLVQEAIDSLFTSENESCRPNVILTPHVGSNLKYMLDAVGDVVEESLKEKGQR